MKKQLTLALALLTVTAVATMAFRNGTVLTSPTTTAAVTKADEGGIKWLSIEEAVKASKKKKKKVIVDVYTDWCGWCKRMDKNTFGDPAVAKYVSENFYAVKFNAEGADNVIFQDKVFKFAPQYKSHELAVAWLGGHMSYPTIVYLDEAQNKIAAIPGYYEAAQMRKLLQYIHEEQYKKNVSLDDYLKK